MLPSHRISHRTVTELTITSTQLKMAATDGMLLFRWHFGSLSSRSVHVPPWYLPSGLPHQILPWQGLKLRRCPAITLCRWLAVGVPAVYRSRSCWCMFISLSIWACHLWASSLQQQQPLSLGANTSYIYFLLHLYVSHSSHRALHWVFSLYLW